MTKAIVLRLPDMSWHVQAACHDDNRPPEVKAEWFGPLPHRSDEQTEEPVNSDEQTEEPVNSNGRPAEKSPTVRAALALCLRCDVVERCDLQARLDPHARGVWGNRYITGRA